MFKNVASLTLSALILCSCANVESFLGSPKGQAVLTISENIAQIALEAAATNFGGPLAGKLAGAGLDALGSVLQGYIGRLVPKTVVMATPGVKGVGPAVAPLISSTKPVTQADVNAIFKAA